VEYLKPKSRLDLGVVEPWCRGSEGGVRRERCGGSLALEAVKSSRALKFDVNMVYSVD
jgi:hypothetical protein